MASPTEEELGSVALAAQKLWELDENRLTPEEDYKLTVGQGKDFYDKGDVADGKLFGGVRSEVWQKPTYLIFYNLLDNYERETGNAETNTEEEQQEVADFLSAVLETPCMKYCHEYLVALDKAPSDPTEFRKFLYQMWFYNYSRDGRNDTSGFEHVFVGESDSGKITGLHNWIQIFIEEAKGNLDYMGFIRPRKATDDPIDHDDRLLSIQFGWDGEVKSVSSIFVGTSPEFELALYTMCFHAGGEETNMVLADTDVLIKTYRIKSKYGDKVGSAFPQVG